ncbi:MAG: peptide-methionine (S)-S-oxide reductase MsrA [Verrucomicrobiota bacterium]|jgi:peptide-methionine (S)-S-oxide reductase|nr:peptide-methionine (S)-S-oxide reductase MsrA [Verrucomicrobiota bacterium]MDP7047842.1 peptide-methionine (S)-S-oxide reductase MsrA [Verrucomicrobiota bacterium]
MNTILKLFSWVILFCCVACGRADNSASKPPAIPKNVSKPSNEPLVTPPPKVGMITLGGGCFWCVEAVYQRIDGITKVTSGYMGGTVPNPTYKQICTGLTGHAEVVKVEFDPAKISLEKVLAVFWKAHDPTTLNRQGADIGTQYRSAIFYHTDADKVVAEKSMKAAGSSGEFRSPIVTEITKASIFYKAEEYHQNYFNLNANAPYCRAVIWPKLRKLGLKFKKE